MVSALKIPGERKSKTLANRGEVEDMWTHIQRQEFARLVIFADAINRYTEMRFKDKVNWLWVNALIRLIGRGGSVTISELADLMFRSNNNITWLVDNLEKEGLVRRRRLGKDRRTVTVQVTSAGLSFMRDNLEEIAAVQTDVMSCLDDGEDDTLRGLIWKIIIKLSNGRAVPPGYQNNKWLELKAE